MVHVAQLASVQIGLHKVYAELTSYPLEHPVHVVERSQVVHKGTLQSSLQLPVSLLNLYPLRQEVHTEGDEQLWQKASRQTAMQLVLV